MKVRFLRATLYVACMLGVGVVVGSGACGGNVVLDGSATSPGAGGSTGQGGGSSITAPFSSGTQNTTSVGDGSSAVASSTTSVSSTGTGQMCDCTTVCNNVAPCGLPSATCLGFCPQAPATILQCLCNAGSSCTALQACVASLTTGAAGAGAGSTVASSGGIPSTSTSTSGGGAACLQCAEGQLTGACSTQALACVMQTDCRSILQCEQMCGFGAACTQKCENGHAAGVSAYDTLIKCAVCQSCASECAGQPVSTENCN